MARYRYFEARYRYFMAGYQYFMDRYQYFVARNLYFEARYRYHIHISRFLQNRISVPCQSAFHSTQHSAFHSTNCLAHYINISWLLQNHISAPWAVFHSTVNQCILNSYAMITHYHYERLGYFDDQQVLYDEHSGDYQDVFDARATWFRSFILMPCFIQSIPRYTRVVTIQCRHYIG